RGRVARSRRAIAPRSRGGEGDLSRRQESTATPPDPRTTMRVPGDERPTNARKGRAVPLVRPRRRRDGWVEVNRRTLVGLTETRSGVSSARPEKNGSGPMASNGSPSKRCLWRRATACAGLVLALCAAAPILASDDFEDNEVVVSLAAGVAIASIDTRYGTVMLD